MSSIDFLGRKKISKQAKSIFFIFQIFSPLKKKKKTRYWREKTLKGGGGGVGEKDEAKGRKYLDIFK